MARPFAEVVRAKNLSPSGAMLLGVRAKIRSRELLEVQHGPQRAQFRIAWAEAGEAGIQSLPSQPCIWQVAFPEMSEMVGTG